VDHRATSKAQPHRSAADEVERIALELEQLAHFMRLGHPTHAACERHADAARGHAAALDALFRKPTRAINPPAYLSPDGTKAVW